ncbi:MAG: T9SS type A sorting domain-containing protein [Bacteroidota bacterium]
MRSATLLCLLLLPAFSAAHSTDLQVGDLALTMLNADSPDSFAFVLLTDLSGTTTLHFTDNGWDPANDAWLNTSEGVLTWTYTGRLPFGTEVHVDAQAGTASQGSLSKAGSFNVSSAGDVLLAYTGLSEAPSFIYGMNIQGGGWPVAPAVSSTASGLPAVLTDGDTALGVTAHADNWQYGCTLTNAEAATLRAAIADEANWSAHNTTPYDAPGCGLLPVELVVFEAFADGPHVWLRWETAAETNNAGFEVQYVLTEIAAGAWHTITFVEGHGTTLKAQRYTQVVPSLAPGRYRFRLKQTDFDGTHAYSPEVEVAVDGAGGLHLAPPYPNPFSGQTTLTFTVPQAMPVNLSLYDLLGRRARVLYHGDVPSGPHTVHVDARTLADGVYLARLETAMGSTTQRLVLLR